MHSVIQILASLISLGISIALTVMFGIMYVNTQKIKKCVCH